MDARHRTKSDRLTRITNQSVSSIKLIHGIVLTFANARCTNLRQRRSDQHKEQYQRKRLEPKWLQSVVVVVRTRCMTHVFLHIRQGTGSQTPGVPATRHSRPAGRSAKKMPHFCGGKKTSSAPEHLLDELKPRNLQLYPRAAGHDACH